MNHRTRIALGVGLAALVFLLVQLGALALLPSFYAEGYQTVEDPTNPVNSLVYIGAILVATAFMLAAFKYDLDELVRVVIVGTSGLLGWYVFNAVVPPALAGGGLLPVALGVVVAVALYVYPEWYVIDAAGVLMGAGSAAFFGISFGLLPAVVLLVFLAVYDAISVYGTKHMLDLAEGVMDLHIPVVLVIPTRLSYSLLDDDFSDVNDVHDEANDGTDADASDSADVDANATAASDGEDESVDDAESDDADGTRDALFIGLGDAVMPTVMIASAAFFSPAASLGVGGLPALNLPALTSMVGTFVGLAVLLWAVLKGRAHAGLPLLNGGAIVGYLLGSFAAGVPLVTALGLAPYL